MMKTAGKRSCNGSGARERERGKNREKGEASGEGEKQKKEAREQSYRETSKGDELALINILQ